MPWALFYFAAPSLQTSPQACAVCVKNRERQVGLRCGGKSGYWWFEKRLHKRCHTSFSKHITLGVLGQLAALPVPCWGSMELGGGGGR